MSPAVRRRHHRYAGVHTAGLYDRVGDRPADPLAIGVRILHVGWGFWPFRKGGLINYAQDLMAAQAERGHDVAYFFTGRHYRGRSGPRIATRS